MTEHFACRCTIPDVGAAAASRASRALRNCATDLRFGARLPVARQNDLVGMGMERRDSASKVAFATGLVRREVDDDQADDKGRQSDQG